VEPWPTFVPDYVSVTAGTVSPNTSFGGNLSARIIAQRSLNRQKTAIIVALIDAGAISPITAAKNCLRLSNDSIQNGFCGRLENSSQLEEDPLMTRGSDSAADFDGAEDGIDDEPNRDVARSLCLKGRRENPTGFKRTV
jgi:hypothetical protein